MLQYRKAETAKSLEGAAKKVFGDNAEITTVDLDAKEALKFCKMTVKPKKVDPKKSPIFSKDFILENFDEYRFKFFAGGSITPTSDIDINVVAEVWNIASGKEVELAKYEYIDILVKIETLVTKAYNDLVYEANGNVEPGLLFDVNLYVADKAIYDDDQLKMIYASEINY